MFTRRLEDVQEMLGRLDGDHSELFLEIKDRVSDYPCEELPFPYEFLLFEDHYLKAMEHMMISGITPKRIVDIGCQNGFQSELLDGVDYVGLDCDTYRSFNADKPGVSYIKGTFPDVELDLSDAVVISSMSLGYFDHWVCQDKEVAATRIADALAKCENLYIATNPSLIEELKKRFPVWEVIEGGEFPFYWFGKTTGIAETLAVQNSLFIAASPLLIDELKRRFPAWEYIDHSGSPFYWFGRTLEKESLA